MEYNNKHYAEYPSNSPFDQRGGIRCNQKELRFKAVRSLLNVQNGLIILTSLLNTFIKAVRENSIIVSTLNAKCKGIKVHYLPAYNESAGHLIVLVQHKPISSRYNCSTLAYAGEQVASIR